MDAHRDYAEAVEPSAIGFARAVGSAHVEVGHDFTLSPLQRSAESCDFGQIPRDAGLDRIDRHGCEYLEAWEPLAPLIHGPV